MTGIDPSRNIVKNWQEHLLPDLSGKCFVITGGNSGIGLQAARMLGARGANLILACRSIQKGEEAKTSLQPAVSGFISIVKLNLADSSSIQQAAEVTRNLTTRIDGLINNAGIMQTPERKTADGFELQFGTNHLGHFLWTSLLIDLVEAAAGRVVTVSSIAHRVGRMNFADLNFRTGYTPSKAYGQSKLANLMFAMELDRRLEAAGNRAISIACHPGYSATNLQSTGPSGLLKLIYKPLNAFLAQPSKLGALPTVLAAAGTEAQRGHYYGPTGFLDMLGPVGDSRIASHGLNEDHWIRLWRDSEALLGISFPTDI
nr:oxidoreductase [uncultured Cohaesibacter sp.]